MWKGKDYCLGDWTLDPRICASGHLSSSIVIRTAMSASGRASRGQNATLLAHTSEDIEKKRHRRNPFGHQYMQLLQTPLEEVRSVLDACKFRGIRRIPM